MAKRTHQAKDTAWKDILDAYFKEFVELCWPALYPLIDWSKPWESLDKELHTITAKRGVIGKRLVDKLIKVYLLDGQEKWILIHLEVQDKKETSFSERMFVYLYRIYDRYKQLVISCVILTDGNSLWRPDVFEMGLAGSSLRFDYPLVKLLDYRSQTEMLDASTNVFASVILSHLAAQAVKHKSANLRKQTKLNLTKRLYQKGYSKEQVQKLYLFIDWLLHLSPKDELDYEEAIYELEAETNMPYISTIEQRGIEKGLSQGIHQGESTVLLRLLERKFKTVSDFYRQKLLKASSIQLLMWAEQLLDASSIDDVFSE